MTKKRKPRDYTGRCRDCRVALEGSGFARCPTCLLRDRVAAKWPGRPSQQHQRNLVLDAKERPCVDCGVVLPPAVMELDHVTGKKRFTLGSSEHRTDAEIIAEIAKCVVRCPNCHKLRHYRERLAARARHMAAAA